MIRAISLCVMLWHFDSQLFHCCDFFSKELFKLFRRLWNSIACLAWPLNPGKSQNNPRRVPDCDIHFNEGHKKGIMIIASSSVSKDLITYRCRVAWSCDLFSHLILLVMSGPSGLFAIELPKHLVLMYAGLQNYIMIEGWLTKAYVCKQHHQLPQPLNTRIVTAADHSNTDNFRAKFICHLSSAPVKSLD